jgi:Flp pilus assembly secretin CpaC
MCGGVRAMKTKMIGNLSWVLLVAAVAVIVMASLRRADAAEPVRQPVNLTAGESYVIEDLAPGAIPATHVLTNPHALIVHADEPGKLVLLATEAGEWEIDVVRSGGLKTTYDVKVSAVAKPDAPLVPGKTPPPMTDMSLAPLSRPIAPVAGASAAEVVHVNSDSSAAMATIGTSVTPAPLAVATTSIPVHPTQTGFSSPQRSVYSSNPRTVDSEHGYYSPSVDGGPHYLPEEAVSIMTGSSEVVDFKRRLTRISIADSQIADVQVINPYQINVIGHQPGFTTLAVWDDQGQYAERQVRIEPGGKQQVMLNVIVAELDRNNLENQGVNISAALTHLGVSLVGMPGNVGTPYSASGSSSGSSVPTTLNAAGMIMPLLLSSNITYGLAAGNSNVDTQSFFQFLEQHNLGRILAEPRMLANSGEKAKFLSGGEIPIVIAQALNTSIVFKQFGTSVEFIPTVVGTRTIELLVKPEVSEPDYAHGVQLFGFSVPAFVTRRAETMVRMRDGQTLIIAGLIDRERTSEVQKVPYLGDIPYLGGLFRNTTWQDKVTDLVMAVTPELVNPLPDGAKVFEPSQQPEMTYDEIKTQPLNTPDPARPRF